MMLRKLRQLRTHADALCVELESLRSQLPPELRVLSLDTLSSYQKNDRDAIEQNFGASPLVIIQFIIAAWPLIKLIWELIGKDS